MPIPQMSKKIRSGQGWRASKKRYVLKSRPSYKRGASYSYFRGKPHDSFFKKIFKKLAKLAIILMLLGILFLVISFVWLSRQLPNPNQLMERQVAQSTVIYDRTGKNILYEVHGNEKRTLVKLSDIPDNLKWATIVTEDKDFYKHKGFSLWAIFRTLATNILRGRMAGGSTLTQQFIKNAILTNEKTYTRKIKELVMAYRMEKKFSKDEILQMYFNEIPYGSTAYGVEAASQRYFGKSVHQINLPEAAILAALPQAPSRYSPYGSHKDLLLERQHYILDLMQKHGYISKEEADVAKGVTIKFKEPTENIIAPHFVMYIKEILGEKYGEKMVEQGGLKIYTTLDLYKQKIAEEAIKTIAPKNEEKFQAKNAALVSLDPKTGQILAMVGSRDYFNEDIDGQVNVAISLRQPGSSIKPIVYATAFTKGYTPNTVLYDVVTNFSTDPAKPYEPHDYDLKEHGPVTVKQALAGSLNIPAVKAIYLAGIDTVLNLARELGYTSFADRNRFGLSLVLGGGEVKLLEHANAFSAFAREGVLHPINPILKIEDKEGKIIEEYKDDGGKKVLEANIARMLNDILSDNAARTYIFGEKNYLTLSSRPVAAKTGTTNDYHDAWTIGYTPSIVTGVWVGNSDNTAMKRGADGSVVAAPIWHEYMEKVLGDTPVETFKAPDVPKTGKPILDGNIEGTTMVKIDKASGLLATEYTPASFTLEKPYREDHCILYYINKDDPIGASPKDPTTDLQFNLWESRVREWAGKQGFATSSPPTEYDNLHKPENRPEFTIESPFNNQVITDPVLRAQIKATAPRGIARAEYYVNNNLIYTNSSYPFNLEKNIGFLNNGYHSLKVGVCDDIDNCSEKTLDFNLILSQTQKNTDISLSWVEPSGEVALNINSFPVVLKINISNPEQTAKTIFYYVPEGGGEPSIIKIAAPIESNVIQAEWTVAPPTGNYKIYAEARGWNGQTVKSEELKITVSQ